VAAVVKAMWQQKKLSIKIIKTILIIKIKTKTKFKIKIKIKSKIKITN